MLASLRAVEEALYQVKNQSPKDKIAYPIRLNDRLTGLRSNLESGDGAPTAGHHRVFESLSQELAGELERLRRIVEEEIPRLERLITE